MTRISSGQIRQKALHAVENLHYSEAQVAEIFGVSSRTVRRWLAAWRESGRLAPLRHGHRKSVFSADEREKAEELLRSSPDMSLQELKDALGTEASLASVCRLRQQAQSGRKKRNQP